MTVRSDDPDLSYAFSVYRKPFAVVGPDGRVLGTFTPAPTDPSDLGPDLSKEELERRLADPRPGYTGEQVLAHLRSLKCSN